MPTIQPLPAEIREQVDKLTAFVAQCEGELLSLQRAADNWIAQRRAAQSTIQALKAKYGRPTLAVWPPEEVIP